MPSGCALFLFLILVGVSADDKFFDPQSNAELSAHYKSSINVTDQSTIAHVGQNQSLLGFTSMGSNFLIAVTVKRNGMKQSCSESKKVKIITGECTLIGHWKLDSFLLTIANAPPFDGRFDTEEPKLEFHKDHVMFKGQQIQCKPKWNATTKRLALEVSEEGNVNGCDVYLEVAKSSGKLSLIDDRPPIKEEASLGTAIWALIIGGPILLVVLIAAAIGGVIWWKRRQGSEADESPPKSKAKESKSWHNLEPDATTENKAEEKKERSNKTKNSSKKDEVSLECHTAKSGYFANSKKPADQKDGKADTQNGTKKDAKKAQDNTKAVHTQDAFEPAKVVKSERFQLREQRKKAFDELKPRKLEPWKPSPIPPNDTMDDAPSDWSATVEGKPKKPNPEAKP